MAQLTPTVRYLILCEDVHTDPEFPRKVTIVGLLSSIHSMEEPPYPLLYEELCVFVQLAECRGPGDFRVEVRHADSDQVVFRTRSRTVQLPNDPLEVKAILFRLRSCLFMGPGLYWVQLWYNDAMLEQKPLVLR